MAEQQGWVEWALSYVNPWAWWSAPAPAPTPAVVPEENKAEAVEKKEEKAKDKKEEKEEPPIPLVVDVSRPDLDSDDELLDDSNASLASPLNAIPKGSSSPISHITKERPKPLGRSPSKLQIKNRKNMNTEASPVQEEGPRSPAPRSPSSPSSMMLPKGFDPAALRSGLRKTNV
eukprot:TRINITY_DN4234_c0_g1_i1.p1 TRINITY_DN4234_c0_g1~~TRINITY_DN4234_c0_g1_i1.p1  ORF type:complete len:185 (+),score=70.80 TRINITY_DN4234_c0_g1_i1:35-556(+)